MSISLKLCSVYVSEPTALFWSEMVSVRDENGMEAQKQPQD